MMSRDLSFPEVCGPIVSQARTYTWSFGQSARDFDASARSLLLRSFVQVSRSGNNIDNPNLVAIRQAIAEQQTQGRINPAMQKTGGGCCAGGCCAAHGGSDGVDRGQSRGGPRAAAMDASARRRVPSGDAQVQQDRMRAQMGEGRAPRADQGSPQARAAAPNARAGSPRVQNEQVSMQDIQNRQFRGFREVDVNRLRESLPPQARHLAQTFVDAGRRHNLDPIALAAIARHETGNFTSDAFRNRNNAMGVSNRRGPITMRSHEHSVNYMAERLASRTGPYKDAQNLRDLWHVYSPPSTARGGRTVENDPRDLNRHWGAGVERFIRDYERQVGLR